MKGVRQKKREQARHADDWLMTYADTITLLLCFFVVFLSVTVAKKETVQRVETPPPVVQPIKTPTVTPSVIVPVEPVKPPDTLEGNLPFHDVTQDEAKSAEPLPPPAPETPEIVAPEPPPPLLQSLPANESHAASLPEIMDRLKSQGTASIEQKGDRITTLEISSTAFFGSGSATLSGSGKSILQDVAVNLKSDKFRDYQVTVEGHTDDAPIKTIQFLSNWELSTARAASVVRFFIDQGVPAKRLRASGYGDTFPVAPNRDANGNPIPENQAKNRRVVIKLEKIDKSE